MSIGKLFRKDVISMGQRDESKEERGCVKQVGVRHFEVLYFVQFLPSGQTFLERYGDSDH